MVDRQWRYFRVGWLLAALAVLSVPAAGCGSGNPTSAEAPLSLAELNSPEHTPVVTVIRPPTATPWPTFTPVPAATSTAVPAVAVDAAATATAAAVDAAPVFAEPAPAEADVYWGIGTVGPPDVGVNGNANPDAAMAGPDVAVEVEADLVPTPTPYGMLYRGGVKFVRQSLFPVQEDIQPTFILERNWDDMPGSYDFVLSGTHHVYWVVIFDVGEAPPDFEFPGVVRWVDITPGFQQLVMHQTPVLISREQFFFLAGVGDEFGQVWSRPGRYRVEFLDDRNYLVLDWEFEVR